MLILRKNYICTLSYFFLKSELFSDNRKFNNNNIIRQRFYLSDRKVKVICNLSDLIRFLSKNIETFSRKGENFGKSFVRSINSNYSNNNQALSEIFELFFYNKNYKNNKLFENKVHDFVSCYLLNDRMDFKNFFLILKHEITKIV